VQIFCASSWVSTEWIKAHGLEPRAREGEIIREMVAKNLGLPTIELEIPPVCDAMLPTLSSRLQALVETAAARRT